MIPLSHNSDPDSSKDAEARITGKEQVFSAIMQIIEVGGPATPHELTTNYFKVREYFDWPLVDQYSIKRRASELLQMGVLKRTGESRRTPSGRFAKVLEVAK